MIENSIYTFPGFLHAFTARSMRADQTFQGLGPALAWAQVWQGMA